MSLFDTKHKRKSFTLTSFLLLGLLILLFYVGLAYLEPPPEKGILVNFGTTNTGKGKQPPKTIVQKKVKKVSEPQEKIKEVVKETVKQEKILANELEETVVIPNETKNKKATSINEIKEAVKKEEKQVPSKITTDALSSIINSENTTSVSEGNDVIGGDKGQPEGDPYANNYYGSTGSAVGYGLNGRSLVNRGKVQQECDEEGSVVVKIEVSKNGDVVSAIPGVKGTTNNHPCLIEPARKTAFLHKWNPDPKAPNRQIGFVVVNFKLGE
ncbi:energy transducer TonB [Leptobacterium sp. I13]|uniref:energy transducer TonB n=1 Tax=Leptobacterium meishanense TaxID=3128904 RepID=UPI0030ED2542